MQLQIYHSGWRDSLPMFEVVRSTDMKRTTEIQVPSPMTFPVINRPADMLLPELRWYMEDYLRTPFGAYRKKTKDIVETVQEWGKAVFDMLFTGYARDWYQEVKRKNFADFRLEIVSDSPEIMSWPWEALYSEEDGYLALSCCIDRQLCTVGDPIPLPDNLAQDAIHILYILSRPKDGQEVGYHTLASSLIDYSDSSKIPVAIDVLRPPTFDQLRKTLHDHPGYYHIVHFDGHGGYGELSLEPFITDYASSEGLLVFETNEGDSDPIETTRLSQLLAEYNIPIMVMNACQSGMIDEHARDPFASVATGMLKAGIRSVVAMGYSLYVSGAREFIPAFYESLFSNGKISEAVRAGRCQMFRQPDRTCVIGKERLPDWLVPVLYQNLPAQEEILPTITPCRNAGEKNEYLPDEVREIGDYGFIGRGDCIQRLEQAVFRQPQAGLLIHGQIGIGKTTLVKGFLQWLQNTGGLCAQVFWFDFREIYSAEYIIDTLISALCDFKMVASKMDEKLAFLVNAMRADQYLVVWDNFESATGNEHIGNNSQLKKADLKILKTLLKKLRGGRTKILITSSSQEKWLQVQSCFRIRLGGLAGEDLWEYCNAVVRDLGLNLNRNDPCYRGLLEKLCGNPLAVRAILLQLNEKSAEQLLQELDTIFAGAEGDESTRRLQVAFSVFGKKLLERFLPILQVIGLFEHYIMTAYVENTLSAAGISVEGTAITECFHILENAGFCTEIYEHIFLMHPALRSYLLDHASAPEQLQRSFVKTMKDFTVAFENEESYIGEYYCKHNLANVYHAKQLSELLGMNEDALTITHSMGCLFWKQRRFADAYPLFLEAVEKAKICDNIIEMARAYYHLGLIAREYRDYNEAESWCQKSLEISKKQENAFGVTLAYHHLGLLAEEQNNFKIAEDHYQEALKVAVANGFENEQVGICHQLGNLAEIQRNSQAAEFWYGNSLNLQEKLGDKVKVAATYHQLGIIAQRQRDFPKAKDMYLKALKIKKKYCLEYDAAVTAQNLGTLAYDQGNYKEAEGWYKKVLAVFEKQDDKYHMIDLYNNLGLLAYQQEDFKTAEDWWRLALGHAKGLKEEQLEAGICCHLGMLTADQNNFETAENLYNRALDIHEQRKDMHGIATIYHQIGILAQKQMDFEKAEENYKKALEIFSKCRDMYSAARSCHQLGRIAEEQHDFFRAADFFMNALIQYQSWENSDMITYVLIDYIRIQNRATSAESKELRKLWESRMPKDLTVLLDQVEVYYNDAIK